MLRVRMAPELLAAVNERGGADWVREAIEQRINEEGPEMKAFTIAMQSGGGELLGTVRARTHEDAARGFVRRTKRSRAAHRVTGSHGMSGCFQGYDGVRGGGQTSAGPQFHVSEA